MKYELLDKIVPDHELIIQNSNVVSVDDKFIKILQKNPNEIIYDLDLNTFFEQFEHDLMHKNFNEQFMNDLRAVIKAGQRAIMLINSVIKEKQSEALYLFLINVQKVGAQIKLKLYNLVTLTKVFKGLFSKDLWQNLRGTFVDKSSSLIKKQLYCAHEVLLSIYNLSNYSLFTFTTVRLNIE